MRREMNAETGTIYSRSTAINMSIKCCTYCGKRHASKCGLRNHPDANDETTIEWADSKIGKAIIAAGSGKSSIEIHMRWDAANKRVAGATRKTYCRRDFERSPKGQDR